MRIFTIALAALMLSALSAHAQFDDDDIALVQSMFGKTKRAIVAEYVTVSESQSPAFWQLYDRYEIERKEIVRDRFLLIRRYAAEYDSITADQAIDLARGFIQNTGKMNALQATYVRKFEKLIGGLSAATLFQVELYLQTAMQADLQCQIPIIGQLKKLQIQQGTTPVLNR